jgi:hypothetical protein
MSQQNSTQATAEQQTEVQIFRLLAGAIHNHLPAESIDETKVREIVEAEVANFPERDSEPKKIPRNCYMKHDFLGSDFNQSIRTCTSVGQGKAVRDGRIDRAIALNPSLFPMENDFLYDRSRN